MTLGEGCRILFLDPMVPGCLYPSTDQQEILLWFDCGQTENTQWIRGHFLDHYFLAQRTCGNQFDPSSDIVLQPSSQSCFFRYPLHRLIKVRSDTVQCSPTRLYFVVFASECFLSSKIECFQRNRKDSISLSNLDKPHQLTDSPEFWIYQIIPRFRFWCDFGVRL